MEGKVIGIAEVLVLFRVGIVSGTVGAGIVSGTAAITVVAEKWPGITPASR